MAYKKRTRSAKRPRPKQPSKRTSMLNLHRLIPFKYDLREIMENSEMDPDMAQTFLANVIAKASRVSIRDAKTYVGDMVDEERIDSISADRVCRLLDRYTRYR